MTELQTEVTAEVHNDRFSFAVVASLSLEVWQVRRQRTLAEAKSIVSATMMQFLSGIAKVRVAGPQLRCAPCRGAPDPQD